MKITRIVSISVSGKYGYVLITANECRLFILREEDKQPKALTAELGEWLEQCEKDGADYITVPGKTLNLPITRGILMFAIRKESSKAFAAAGLMDGLGEKEKKLSIEALDELLKIKPIRRYLERNFEIPDSAMPGDAQCAVMISRRNECYYAARFYDMVRARLIGNSVTQL